jgi:hypothetical protein
MLLLIIFIIAFIITSFFIIKNLIDEVGWGGSIIATLLTMCAYMLGLLLFSIMISGIWFNENNVQFTKHREPITSLKYNNNGISGSFFLGSGSVESTRYYYFLKKNDDGSFTESRVEADGTKVFEDADSLHPPYIVRKYDYKITSPTFKLFYLKSSEGTVSVDGMGCNCSSENKMEIHVPKGTIIQEYQIRL